MNKRRISFLVVICFVVISDTYTQVPFSRGVNLTNWFQASSAQQIQFTKFTRQDFLDIKSLGCDVIRLPINLHAMTSGSPGYIIDPLFFTFLDSAVSWAEELQIHLLLDNHTFDPATNTDPEIGPVLCRVWTQMADHYKDRSRYIYYEVLNEPHGILDQVWGQIQQGVIDSIRSVDTVHTIIVGPAGWNGYTNLNALPVYTDTNLIYTFHFYDPFLFTHQGASWTDPSLVPLAGVPFPYDAERMPSCPPELQGTWIESGLNNYETDGTVESVQNRIHIPASFMNNRKVPLFCGEFGAYKPNSNDTDRVRYYQTVSECLENNGIAWTMWDYKGGFGIFEAGSGEMFDYDINIPLVEALGLIVPEQKEMIITPDTAGFHIYFEYIEETIEESSWTGGGSVSYYDSESPFAGNYNIKWSDGSRYNFVGFDFKPDKDLSYLVDNDYAIDFWVRGYNSFVKFDIRFLDTKTGEPDDHPWRMKYTIDNSVAVWDGTWQYMHIPLKSFSEGGSWDNNTWYNPMGKFDWKAVDRFEIVAEYMDMSGIEISFDNLSVTNIIASVETEMESGNDVSALKIFPNPAHQEVNIIYTLTDQGFVEMDIYNMTGQKIINLVNKYMTKGEYAYVWKILNYNLPPGIYFCRLSASGEYLVQKVIISQE
jgi:endoglucanase